MSIPARPAHVPAPATAARPSIGSARHRPALAPPLSPERCAASPARRVTDRRRPAARFITPLNLTGGDR